MEEREQFRPSLIPPKPGVYVYRDRLRTVIYVGKAVNLKRRMSSYFQASRQRLSDPKLRSLINSIAFFEFTVVKNEDEALLLESQLVKAYMPRFNVLLRDDKRFPLIKLKQDVPFPRLEYCRFKRNDGAEYWGPFPHSGAIRETIRFLNEYFHLRGCRAEIPGEKEYKHCLSGTIRLCSAPCIGKITPEAYRENVRHMIDVLSHDRTALCDALKAKMVQLAEAKRFEPAARCRDVLMNIEQGLNAHIRRFTQAKVPMRSDERAVESLMNELNLPRLPLRIEGFDNSHSGGKFPVSSMVCFLNGKPAPQQYRKFHLRTADPDSPDDYAAMKEVLTRYYSRRVQENHPLPDFILIDGGKGQLHAAMEALSALNLSHIPIGSLAKQDEEIFVPGREESYKLDRHNPAVRLLQAVRDEAHRFCITFNRALRNAKIEESALDEIEGIGPERKKALLIACSSVRAMRKMTPEMLCQKVPRLGLKLAERILTELQKPSTKKK